MARDRFQSGAPLNGVLLNVRLHGDLSFPIAEELAIRDVPFVFVTGNDPTVTKGYPDIPAHPKLADMDAVVSSRAMLMSKPAASVRAPVTRGTNN